MSKPSILLIPGSFSLPSFYDNIVNAVAAKGYEIKALHNPTTGTAPNEGREGAPPTMYDDAANIAKEAEKLADEGKDVILVAHSYGGIPTSQSTKGLEKEERQKQGKKGGIVRIAYMTCLVPPVGGSAGTVLVGVPDEQKVELGVDEKGWMYQADLVLAASICFSDIPKEDGLEFMKRFPRHSAISFANELTHGGYKNIPVSYLLCEEDLCIPPAVQREGIAMIEKESGKKVDVTSIKTGHGPVHEKSAPQKVIDWILDVAAKA
ncbi:methylesterase 6 protein [Rutstroemia sp. NJR-2017a WRK4]|nr:methylesterase 6 protein [Rutstroemia sp. NJR-2017a WRK4]